MWTKTEIDEEFYPIDLCWTDDDQIKLNLVLDIRKKYLKNWSAILKRRYNDIYEWLLHRHPLLDDSYSLVTKLYWLMHKLVFFQKCPVCGKTKHMHKNIDSFENGYIRACCKECAAANPERQRKIADTTEKHYGSRNFFTSECGKAKTKAYLNALGVVNVFQLDSVKQKSCETRKVNFGFEYTMQSPEKRKLASDNYKKKTGYTHQFSNPEIIEKSRKTQQDNINAGLDPKAKFKKKWRIKRYNSIVALTNEIQPLFSLEYFMQFDSDSQYHVMFDWHCNKCGKDFSAYLDQNLITREHLPARCLHCHPILNGASKPEYEIADFIKTSCNICDLSMHNRSVLNPYEIDIAIPSRKTGIEYDGLYYHSEFNGGKPKSYHVFKTNEAQKKGYQLIHVFEDEWMNKRLIVESRLKSIFGMFDRKIFARKCIVSSVDTNTSKKFLNENHLQGWSHSSVNLGLYYDNGLVALMTFGKPRYNKQYEWELIRYCSLLNVQVIGGAGKLLKAFEMKCRPKSLLSYADYRWSTGKMYESLGFKLDHVSEPNYWYVKSSICERFSRIKFQKFKLKRLLDNFDNSLSEVENMRNNGFDRIFDCGNLVYVKTYI